MVTSKAIKGIKKARTNDEAINAISFPNGLLEIQHYKLTVNDSCDKPRIYMIETHKYKGFAMIKYYPDCLKKHPKKYEVRGKAVIGYLLRPYTVLEIIHECAIIMRDYLEENREEFVGYIGQIDTKDNKRKREQSQRCFVYNVLTSSMFKDSTKYKLSSKKKFKEVNLRLIRVIVSKQEGKLTQKQMQNYNSFLDAFQANTKLHYELMTDSTKEKVIKEIEERKKMEDKALNFHM